METTLRQFLLALEQAQSLTDVNIAAGELRQKLEELGSVAERAKALYEAALSLQPTER